MHFGGAEPHGRATEFAVLLPFERDKKVPALMLSNDHIEVQLELITKALAYSRGAKVR
jgi:hypothetical protein